MFCPSVNENRNQSPRHQNLLTFEAPHVLSRAGSCSINCGQLRTHKKLGYIAGKHMDLYGEHLELVSDPFEEGDCVAVHAVSESNPTERTIELPVSILAGWEDLLQEPADPAESELPTKTQPAELST